MPTTLELRQDRKKLIEDGRKILNKAESENRSLTAEERQQWDRMITDAQALKDRYETQERQEQLDAELGSLTEHRRTDVTRPSQTGANNSDELTSEQRDAIPEYWHSRATRSYKKSFDTFLRQGTGGLYGRDEHRALAADVLASGGYAVLPFQMAQQIWQTLNNRVFVRQHATIHPLVNADKLRVPKLDVDIADAEWTTELSTGTADTAMAFNARDLDPTILVKKILVSDKLLAIAGYDVAGLVNQRLAFKHAVTQEKGFLTGTGTGQPLGVFTASANGISTARDVNTGNTATAMTYDGLVNAKMAVKAQYRGRDSFRWCFHRDGVKQIMTIKDSQNRPIFVESMSRKEPDTVLGIPVEESEYAPNTFTTGLYVGIIGDWSYYSIAETIGFDIYRANELYRDTNQVAFYGRNWVDGQVIFEEPFARVKLA